MNGKCKKRVIRLLAGLLAASVLTVFAGAADGPDAFTQGRTSEVALGSGLVFVTQADGSLWGWGGANQEDWSQLGAGGQHERTEDAGIYGEIYYQDTPLRLMDDVAQVHAGNLLMVPFTTVVKKDGTLWYTGKNTASFHKLDEGIACAISRCAYEILDASAWYEIYAVKTNGELWRYTMKRSPGSSADQAQASWNEVWMAPEKIMSGVKQISAGYQHLLALKTDGSVWSWGDDSLGQLGNGRSGNLTGEEYPERNWTDTPVKVLEHAVSILADWDFSAAVQEDGSLWVWGNTYWDGSTVGADYDGFGLEYSVFTKPVKLADQVKQVWHTQSCILFVRQDGSLWAWGEPPAGMAVTGDEALFRKAPAPTGISGLAAIRATETDWYAIRTDGSLWHQGWSSAQDALVTEQLTGKQRAGTSVGFGDVSAGAYYADAVNWAVENGITSGTGDGTTFSPNQTCTTAQILTFLWRANGSPAPHAADVFADVSADAYYADAAAWAYEKGLVSGTTFGGSAPATRAATVTYLWKLAGKPAAADAAFADVEPGTEYASAVAWAVETGITSGTTATTFSPESTCTRGQIVTFLYRDLGKA